MNSPPKLEQYSAEKFRRWLAGMVSADRPPASTDRDSMKSALVAFLAACPEVYGLNDRTVMWEKIGNASVAALETCNHDLQQWANEVLSGIVANPGKVATCERLGLAMAGLDQHESWQAECLRVMSELRFILPVHARDAWKRHQEETGTQYKGNRGGNE